MNKKEAYQLTIDLWKDIADNNYYSKKQSKYFDKIARMHGYCPLCELFFIEGYEHCWGDCPLATDEESCYSAGHIYGIWGNRDKNSQEAAHEIVRLVQEAYDKLN